MKTSAVLLLCLASAQARPQPTNTLLIGNKRMSNNREIMVWNIGKIGGDNKEIMTRTETAKIDEIMVRNREEIGLGSEIVSRKERMAMIKMKLLDEAAEIETELKRLEEVIVEKVEQEL